MKRFGLVLAVVLACAVLFPTMAMAINMREGEVDLPAGVMLPWAAYPEENWEVSVGDTCYSAASWYGFTKGIVQNAPNYTRFDVKITDPDGKEIVNTFENASDAAWVGELWDPADCEYLGALTPFNKNLGAPQYFTAWFTKSFTAIAGTYTVHSKMVQYRASDRPLHRLCRGSRERRDGASEEEHRLSRRLRRVRLDLHGEVATHPKAAVGPAELSPTGRSMGGTCSPGARGGSQGCSVL